MSSERIYQKRLLRLACLSGLLLLIPACGGESGSAAVGAGPAGRKKIGSLPPKPGGNPTIVGADLEDLPGEAGAYYRNKLEQEKLKRKTQQWVQPPDKDFGKRKIGTIAKGKFRIQNPRDKDHYLKNIRMSCTCQKAFLTLGDKRIEIKKEGQAPILVPAGAKGELEVHVEVPGVGKRYTAVMIDTDDDELPFLRLDLTVIGVTEFNVEHEGRIVQDVFLGQFSVREKKSFKVRVSANDGKPMTLVRLGDLAPTLKVKFYPDGEDSKTWIVEGSIGPGLGEGGLSEPVTLHCEDGRRVEFLVTGFVLPPIYCKPSHLSFGGIPIKRGRTLPVEIGSSEEGLAFDIAKVDVLDCYVNRRSPKAVKIDTDRIQVKVLAGEKKGTKRLLVTVPAGLPRGVFTGRLRIFFTAARFDPRDVLLQGYVR